jgi:hypothetical protein
MLSVNIQVFQYYRGGGVLSSARKAVYYNPGHHTLKGSIYVHASDVHIRITGISNNNNSNANTYNIYVYTNIYTDIHITLVMIPLQTWVFSSSSKFHIFPDFCAHCVTLEE